MKYDNALKIFTNPNLIFTGPRAYFASNDKNLFLITGTGILMYTNLLNIDETQEKIEFFKVSNNFEELFKKYKDENNFSFPVVFISVGNKAIFNYGSSRNNLKKIHLSSGSVVVLKNESN